MRNNPNATTKRIWSNIISCIVQLNLKLLMCYKERDRSEDEISMVQSTYSTEQSSTVLRRHNRRGKSAISTMRLIHFESPCHCILLLIVVGNVTIADR